MKSVSKEGGAQALLATALSATGGIALDATSVFWDDGLGAVHAAPR